MTPDPAGPPAPENPHADLLAVLPRITQLSAAITKGRLTERAADAAGLALDRPAMGVLLSLRTADRALRIGEIADRMQVVGPHVTRQVQTLEKRGLVRRVADPHDRRASLIEPTGSGTEAANRYVTSLLGWFAEALADWPRQDRDDLARLLTRLADDVTARLARFDTDEETEAD
ncbi:MULTISPECIES: MarR family winged helix-turn-helix transcriptional regulator [Streptomyces]|uniref:MarR family winged helix-turn-helix transcriptional regulator n=1 Tax=Streptomyces TaxID=1883 RepID=UPI0004C6F049|nr:MULTISPECIES: MarR family transcriptional regulator [Streptomyces]MBF8169705.1 MarR family transcriptional regulator [Streptomyces olivaceus]MBZ6106448.1 MarR family transcriptional regulator [Streptomyces olivaceus]MBZ6129573.1 MarR family transcriptional regulator [Streptomyces olivaceus]MBZ6170595.1 MarR family transcriptional regulator [Streptomyces olivaceus]MBZ6177979.1 MarR family transcriptional regulator [Streptomyces olivaceus]